MEEPRKPKLLYFIAPPEGYPPFVRQWFVEGLVKGFAEFFDVTVISRDCDYVEMCDTHRPDLAIFDGVVEPLPCRIRVRNPLRCSEVPKIGFMKLDPYTFVRSVWFAEMERLGIENFFAWDPAMAEYTPEIAGRLFYLPAFVDTDLFQDYGEKKVVPLLFLGRSDAQSLQHAWRFKVRKLITERYPAMIVPHPQFLEDVPLTIHENSYARLLNASRIVPTAGSMSKTLVMKHLEIPAAKACLVTERTPIIEAFGFVDMQNCVFADEHDILDKLAYLFRNEDVLEKITVKGYELVRSNHTAKQRPQIYQWLQCYKSLMPGQRIVQPGLFEDFSVVKEDSSAKTYDIISGCADRLLLQQGDSKLRAGKYRQAEAIFLRCLDYVPWMAEPRLRLGLCRLYQGKAKGALTWLRLLLETSLGTYESAGPDPVEWAYLLITLLCLGQRESASVFSRYFSDLQHPELARARWVVGVLSAGRRPAAENSGLSQCMAHPSMHGLPSLTIDEYLVMVCTFLKRCGQWRLARTLALAKNKIRVPNASQKAAPEPPGEKIQEDIPYVLATLKRLDQRRMTVYLKQRTRIALLQKIMPSLARGINRLSRRYPRLRTEIKTFLINHIQIDDW